MTGRRPRILVVEDEQHLAEGILLNLDAEGYDPFLISDGFQALERAKRGGIDLVVLDVMLPSMSGFTVCEELRLAGSKVPVLFLTAKGRAEDRIRGLDLGGDDYLVKPFHLDELLSRVRALLRRQAWYREAPVEDGPFCFGENEVDFASGAARTFEGEEALLTDKELDILRALVERRGDAVTRAELIERCWAGDDAPTHRTIDNFILRLRRRFEPDPRRPRFLQTVFGKGYRFVE